MKDCWPPAGPPRRRAGRTMVSGDCGAPVAESEQLAMPSNPRAWAVSSWVKGCGSAGGSAAAGGGDIQPEGVVDGPSTPISLEASRRGLHV